MHHHSTARQQKPASLSPLRGIRRLVYASGRLLQGLGLVLIWGVLLLFTETVSMGVLLYGSLMAIGVFMCGWVCLAWVKRRG